jgi:hypothetical protein
MQVRVARYWSAGVSAEPTALGEIKHGCRRRVGNDATNIDLECMSACLGNPSDIRRESPLPSWARVRRVTLLSRMASRASQRLCGVFSATS